MAKVKLTSASVLEMEAPAKGQVLVFDADLPGFGVRLTPGKKTYFAQARVRTTGATRRATIGSASVFTVQQARVEAKKLLGQMSGGIDPSAVKAEGRAKVLTLAKAFETYLARGKLKASTLADYEKRFEVYFADWAARQVASITPAMVAKRFATLSDNNGPGAANLAFRILRAVINHARITTKRPDGTFALPDNPVNRLSEAKSWNKLARRKRYVGEDDLPSWFAVICDLQNEGSGTGDYYELLLRTGLRRNEAASLHWENVNLQSRTLTVPNTKSGRPLTLPLSTQLVALFERRQEATGGAGFVFPGDGKAGYTGDARKTLLRVREASGVTFSAHDLRRSFASIGEGLDIGVYSLKALLNHAEDGDVTRGYAIVTQKRLALLMQAISDEIDRLAFPDLEAENATQVAA